MNGLEWMGEFSDGIEAVLHPSVAPDRQKELKGHCLPEGGDLTVRCDFRFGLGAALRKWYPKCWPIVRRTDVIVGIGPSERSHPLTDDELFWLIGDTAWFCTARRIGKAGDSCAAYGVIRRTGESLSEKDIAEQYPLSYPYMRECDFNSLEHGEIYGYESAGNDGELLMFLNKYPVTVDDRPEMWGMLWQGSMTP